MEDKFDSKLLQEREGTVSIWLGNLSSEDEFENYVKEQYGDDDSPISRFAEEFEIGWYDHDFIEADFIENKSSVEEFLSGNSYSSSFINEAVSASKSKGFESCNTKILLYDNEYIPNDRTENETQKLTFIGAFAFDENSSAVNE